MLRNQRTIPTAIRNDREEEVPEASGNPDTTKTFFSIPKISAKIFLCMGILYNIF